MAGMGCLALGLHGREAQAIAPLRRFAITNVRAYASPFQPPMDNAVVLIEGGRIREIQAGAKANYPAGTMLFDGGGGVLVAGYWNSHVHLVTPTLLRAETATDAEIATELQRSFGRWGFTTIVDLASTGAIAGDVDRRINSGRVRGPRVLSAADPFYPPDATPIYARPFYKQYGLPSAETFSASSAAERADRQLRNGADALKIFTGAILGGERAVAHMPPEIVRAIVAVGEKHRRPVFAHPTDRTGLEIAVQNGVRALAHATPLMGPWTGEYASWIARRNVALIPTLSLFEIEPHPSTPVEVAVQQTMMLHRAGGQILFGTDAGFTDRFDIRAELRLLESAIGWREILASLTVAPAALFGEAAIRGRIEPGFAADLVLLGGDPAINVEDLASVKVVFRDGELIHPKTI